MPQRDSLAGTIMIAAILCIVCSLGVSTAAVALRGRQEANKRLDQQRNILDATGLAMGEYGLPASKLSREQVDELYSWISEALVNLEDGSYNEEMDIEKYDALELVNKKATRKSPDKSVVDIGEQYRETVSKVYFVRKNGEGEIKQVVLPVYGKGLWSTLRGYLALKSDLVTIQGLTFYSHAETPGLGGEVDNPNWKAQWEGQKLYDSSGVPAAEVAKGEAPADSEHAVDGLSGATITSRGVTALLQYWAGDDGYGPYLVKLKDELAAGPEETDDDSADKETAEEESSAEQPSGDEEPTEASDTEKEGE